MANKAFKYRLYPNEKQQVVLQNTFGCVRKVYNKMLEVQEFRFVNGQPHLSKFNANRYLQTVLKVQYPFLKEVDKFALEQAVFHLENGYQRFFNKLSKKPKFKSKHNDKCSYTTCFTNNNIVVGNNFVKLPKLGKVKAIIHRFPDNSWKVKSATVSQYADGTCYVSVLFEYNENVQMITTITDVNTIGMDYKSNGLYVDNNGNKPDNTKYYRRSERKLAKLQHDLSRKQHNSKNYDKQKQKVAKLHRHIANQRLDFLHKQSIMITKLYDCVCVEDLNMRAMSNKGFGNGKATLDNGYGMFLTMLNYKLKEKGGYLVKVSKWYPSSQLCHCCGYQNPLLKDLSIRRWPCPICHTWHDRDVNAAINIKNEGLRLLSLDLN